MDAKADNKDTLLSLLYDLHDKFVKRLGHKYLVIEGDAKVYELLQALKSDYRDGLKWVVPLPGDWHTLKNYQTALLKPYFEAGLKSLAEACGYPVASIGTCSQFKRTHYFILEVWEAMYRAMLLKFIELGGTNTPSTILMEDVVKCINSAKGESESELRCKLNAGLKEMLQKEPLLFKKFEEFTKKMAHADDTWKFWVQFVLVDALAYVGLFVAIRTGNWNLRTGSIKQMAPIFTAFDHVTYQKLIINHITDLLELPESVMLMFSQGAFVVNITGRDGHSVAIDESHEMLINRQCKNAVVKPNEDYVNRMAKYITHRTKSLEAIKMQLFPTTIDSEKVWSAYSSNHLDKKLEINVRCHMSALSRVSFFDVPKGNDRGLVNIFTKAKPSNDDMKNFREIGKNEYSLRIAYYILKEPSVRAPNRRKALQTFAVRKVRSKKVSQLEKDKKLLLSAMKKKIHYSQKIGRPVERPAEQLLTLPLSICDSHGIPLKGQKSIITKTLEKRYSHATPIIITPYLPHNWVPQCTLVEGMFIINTHPLPNHSMFGDYANFLLQRYIVSQFQSGSLDVHVIFDTPGRLKNTPKYFEQKRRDSEATIPTNHTCINLTATTTIQHKKWRENHLNCRSCKRNLVLFIGHHFLHKAGTYLQENQTLYVAGAFDGEITDTAWYITGNKDPQPDPAFWSNSEEADTRLWLHVRKTKHQQVLVISPDTDIYMIGLALEIEQSKSVMVQINKMDARELRYLNLSALKKALYNDPDLGKLCMEELPQIIQTIYVCTGCDYISFFSGIGKATFFKYFLQHAAFITGPTYPGSLAQANLDNNWKKGLLAFLRLVGTVYFKKYSSGFDQKSPEVHFLQYCSTNTSLASTEKQHYQWLNNIRETIWYRTKFDNEMMASTEALALHWERSCWVLDMWGQSDTNQVNLKPITKHGWYLKDDCLAVKWDSEENITAIEERVHLLTKGCGCRSGCHTNRCSCKKRGKVCYSGCECQHCTNTPHNIENIMTEVFGSDHDNSDSDSDDYNDCDEERNDCDEERNDCDEEENDCDEEENDCDEEENDCDEEENDCDEEENCDKIYYDGDEIDYEDAF